MNELMPPGGVPYRVNTTHPVYATRREFMDRLSSTRSMSTVTVAMAVALTIGACASDATGSPSTPPATSQASAAQHSRSAAPESASPHPTPSSAWETFESDRYGYSIGHPVDREVLEQDGAVELAGLRPRFPGTDTIATPRSHRDDGLEGTVVIAARELEAGEALSNFTARASLATPCGPGFDHDTTTLGGEPADQRTFECGGTFWVQIAALHGGRGYLVWLISVVPPHADERPINDQFLDTFRFTD